MAIDRIIPLSRGTAATLREAARWRFIPSG
jgi:hypothetical protein